MKKLYLITGAGGHLGTTLVKKLLARGAEVRALVRPGGEALVPAGVQIATGDVRNITSMEAFFDRGQYDCAALIHCAAVISIASGRNDTVWDVNVHGTENVIRLAYRAGVDRVIYVSSVHAIPERPKPEIITEPSGFHPELVDGPYAKSKAEAARLALAASGDLNVSVVHPSGIIGPGDKRRRNHMVRTIHAMARGKIPMSIEGGYDFVDVRDVADGILGCEERGNSGECYILSGRYATIKELLKTTCEIVGRRASDLVLPSALAKGVAPLAERVSLLFEKNAPLLTPYSVRALQSNALFSHEKARQAFGYAPRPLVQSVRDTLFESSEG